MTNIEAMTIGALARLRHQLDHDVARHLSEMRGQVVKTLTPVKVRVTDKPVIVFMQGHCTTLNAGIGGLTCGPGGGGGATSMQSFATNHPWVIHQS